jgi:hypothetical protein
MSIIRMVADGLLIALVVFIAYRVYQRYTVAEGDTWYKKLWHALTASWTIWVQYVVGVLTYISPYLEQAADALNMPEVGQFIHEYLPTDASGKAVLVILIVTIAARLRKVGS